MNPFEDIVLARQQEIGMFESIAEIGKKAKESKPEIPAVIAPVVNAEEAMYEAIETNALTNLRAMGMGALITWADIGDPTADDFDLTAQGMADVDEDGEVSELEEEGYNEILFAMAQGLRFVGVDADVVEELLGGSDKAASSAYVAMANKLEGMDMSEDELIAEFSVQQEGMMEAKKKVIRDGETKWVNKPLKKRRMTSAQRAGLKKARMKAHSASARAKRKKSMRKRGASGM